MPQNLTHWTFKYIFFCLTFVQPITEPIEDDALLASGHQTDGAALHRRAIVDVVLKNEDLQEPEREEIHIDQNLGATKQVTTHLLNRENPK